MRSFKNNLKFDYILTFLRSFNLTHGIWLLYLSIKGFTLFEIGMFESIFHLSSITMEIPTGIIADMYGRRLSRALSVIIYVAYILLMIFGSSLPVICLAFFLCGLSYTFESGSGEALIYDSMVIESNEENYSKFLGKKEIIFQMSMASALLVGGYIASQHYEIGFWVVLLLFVMGLIPIFMMKETLTKKDQKNEKPHKLMYEHFTESIKLIKNDKKLAFLIFTGAIMAAPVTTVFFYFQIHFKNVGINLLVSGILLAAHSVSSAIGGYAAPFLEKKYGEKLILYIIPTFITFSFWLILNDTLIYISFIALGFFDTVFYVVLNDYINKIIPSEKRATVLSVNGFSFSLVMIILFPVIGGVGDNFGLQTSFFVQAVIVTIFLLILIWIISSYKISVKNK